MRTLLVIIPLVLVGCKQGRQAAVSNDGRVASTVDGGTAVAGRGKIGEGGADVAWSPDGQTLAISTGRGTTLWPKGETIAGIGAPYAWSPDGSSLAGIDSANKPVVRNLQSGETRPVEIEISGLPQGLGWTSEGWPFAWNGRGLAVEGRRRIERTESTVQDAEAGLNGEIAWIEGAFGPSKSFRTAMAQPLRLCRWTPSNDRIETRSVGPFGTLLSPASPRRISVPLHFALAPSGTSVAVAGVVVEAGTRTIERLKALAEKQTTKAEQQEAERLLAAARAKTVVVRIDAAGPTTTLWSAPVMLKGDERGVEDLAWSPNGKWLAIARKDGTVRVAAGG